MIAADCKSRNLQPIRWIRVASIETAQGLHIAFEALRGNTAGAKAIIADLKSSLIKRLDELAEFRDSLFDPKPIEVKAPRIQADPELLQRMTRPRTARAAPDSSGVI